MGLVTVASQDWAYWQENKKPRHDCWTKWKMLKMEEASVKEMRLVKSENLHHRRSQADEEECVKKAEMRENY